MIPTYVSAKNGAAPFGYSTMSQITGNLSFNMSTNVFSAFVQDDWQIAPTVKILYGVRYDLYRYPEGIADAPLAQTHNFTVDQNNFGPRVGVAWSFDANTVVRASTGIMYDQPILGGYEQALQLSGSPRAPVYSFNGTSAGAPAFPNGATTGALSQQSPWAISQDLQVANPVRASGQRDSALGHKPP